MKLHATGRDLIIKEAERLISGSINIYTCEFTFDSSWDGYLVTAVFSIANKVVNRAIVDGKCDIPPEVLRPNMRLRIGVFGNDGVRTRPTTYSEWIPVEQGTDTDGKTGKPPEPNVYEQWMNHIDNKLDEMEEAEAAREEAEIAREEAEKIRGKSAVYVGSGDCPEGFNIQIDPDGETWNDGGNEVFVAEYGKTTFAELEEACDSGKILFCRENNFISPMYSRTPGKSMYFYRNNAETNISVYCTSNGWNKTVKHLCEQSLGDIEAALDRIIDIQNSLMGGDGE